MQAKNPHQPVQHSGPGSHNQVPAQVLSQTQTGVQKPSCGSSEGCQLPGLGLTWFPGFTSVLFSAPCCLCLLQSQENGLHTTAPDSLHCHISWSQVKRHPSFQCHCHSLTRAQLALLDPTRTSGLIGHRAPVSVIARSPDGWLYGVPWRPLKSG